MRGSGHSLNRRTLKIEKLLSSSPSQKSALSFVLLGGLNHPIVVLLCWSLLKQARNSYGGLSSEWKSGSYLSKNLLHDLCEYWVKSGRLDRQVEV